ncbi:GTPase-activating protein [Podosphaera aphanis]|nr:GTPase-activating protein [Podosphaera aphanis]
MTFSSGPTKATSSNFYTLNDDAQDDHDMIRGNDSSSNFKLLYSKNKVYLHPTPSKKDNIPGFIALIQKESTTSLGSDQATPEHCQNSSSLLLAWIPERSLGDAFSTYVQVDLAGDGSSPKQSNLVPLPTITIHPSPTQTEAFSVPASLIYSIILRPPSPGWWFGSIIINTRSGDSFPALFFHDSECESTIMQKKKLARENFDPFGAKGEMFWGGDEVIRWLSLFLNVKKSEAEPNIYLIQPSAEDEEAFIGNSMEDPLINSDLSGNMDIETTRTGRRDNQVSRDTHIDPLSKFVKEVGWNLMERFSKVTTFARRTADSVVENPNIPPQVRRLLRNPEVQTLQEEFDSARIYLARWAMGIAEQSERDRNQRTWMTSNLAELEETSVGDFELLDSEMRALSVEEARQPVTLEEWNGYFDKKTGKLVFTIDEVKERIFHGGLDAKDGVRKEAWLFLLNVHRWDSTRDERRAEIASLRDQYIKLKGAWWNRLVDLGGESTEGEWWREQRGRIEKDVHRTDRTIPLFAGEDIPHPDPSSPFAEVGTNVHLEQMKDMLLTYNEYNRDLGYVQGMSDLLAPIYAVTQDDAIAFWAFKNFMERMERNFLRDQSGMRKQLLTLDYLVQLMDPKLYRHLQSSGSTNFFFFFRMLLVWFKREFEWENVLRLWEGLWTDYLTSNFHLFIALAILEKHRDVIMEHLMHFDEVLKYVNELSTTIDLESTLIRAEALFHRFERAIEAIDKKSNFPAPNLRHRSTISHSQPESSIFTSTATGTGTDILAPIPEASVGSKKTLIRSEIDNSKNKGHGGKEIDNTSGELSDLRPKVVSPELRQLLSRDVEILRVTQNDTVL